MRLKVTFALNIKDFWAKFLEALNIKECWANFLEALNIKECWAKFLEVTFALNIPQARIFGPNF